MSEVASLELCKELYELSGWTSTDMCWETRTNQEWNITLRPFKDSAYNDGLSVYYPAYSLGYLLRKLPRSVQEEYRLTLMPASQESWRAAYDSDDGMAWQGLYADTPEDAVVALAIELFKQGVLKKEVV